MMTVCFLPSNKKTYTHHSDIIDYMYIYPITIKCNTSNTTSSNTNSNNIYDIIQRFLEKNSDINVYGFNSTRHEYWGKQNNKTGNKLYFKITISKKDYSIFCVTITPIVGTNTDIKKLTIKIINLLKIYEICI
jgi:hypothetical protein